MSTGSESKKINITPPEGGTTELIIREGAAPIVHEKLALAQYKGRLDTPQQYHSKKPDYYKPQDCTLVINKDEQTVTFYGQEREHNFTKVVGKLEGDPDLAKYHINGTKRWGIKELLQFLKTQRYFFDDKEQHRTLLVNLSQFSANIQTAIEDKNNDDGSKRKVLERTISGVEMNRVFQLTIPIFKGYKPKVFKVEIGLDSNDSGVLIYLLSEELFELARHERDALIAKEEQYFEKWGCAVITES